MPSPSPWLSLVKLPPAEEGRFFGEELYSQILEKPDRFKWLVAVRYFQGRVTGNSGIVATARKITAAKEIIAAIDEILKHEYDPNWKLRLIYFMQRHDQDPNFRKNLDREKISIQSLYKSVILQERTDQITLFFYLQVDRCAKILHPPGSPSLLSKSVNLGVTKVTSSFAAEVPTEAQYLSHYVRLRLDSEKRLPERLSFSKETIVAVAQNKQHVQFQSLWSSLVTNPPRAMQENIPLPSVSVPSANVVSEDIIRIHEVLQEANKEVQFSMWRHLVQDLVNTKSDRLEKLVFYLMVTSKLKIEEQESQQQFLFRVLNFHNLIFSDPLIASPSAKILDVSKMWKKVLSQNEIEQLFSDLHIFSIIAVCQMDSRGQSDLSASSNLFQSIYQYFVRELLDAKKKEEMRIILTKNLLALLKISLETTNFFIGQALFTVFFSGPVARLQLHRRFIPEKWWTELNTLFDAAKGQRALRDAHSKASIIPIPSTGLMAKDLLYLKDGLVDAETENYWRAMVLGVFCTYSKEALRQYQFQTTFNPSNPLPSESFDMEMFELSEKISPMNITVQNPLFKKNLIVTKGDESS